MVVFLYTANIVLSQQVFNIYDNNKLYKEFYNKRDFYMLDSFSEKFLLIKRNVLNYCEDKLEFNIDSIASSYSCKEIINNVHLTSKKVKRIIKKKNLKYIFYIGFKIRDSLYYQTSFILDTNLIIQYTPNLLFNINKEKIFKIIDWQDISNDIRAYKNGYIEPIEHIGINYSNKHRQFVYFIVQGITKSTVCTESKELYQSYKVNLLLVSCENGKILQESKEKIIIHGQPLW